MQHLANFITLLNLACGFGAIIAIFYGDLMWCGYLVIAGAFFDFIDGFAARLLGIASEMGKQLDSLSDIVTFGVVPGMLAFYLIEQSAIIGVPNHFISGQAENSNLGTGIDFMNLRYIAVLLPAFSALRLAKFNIDTRQSKNFIGLPTPANGLFWISIGLITTGAFSGFEFSGGNLTAFFQSAIYNPIVIAILVVITSLLLVSPLKLMGMKFDDYTWRNNKWRMLFVAVAVLLFLAEGFAAAPIILLLYIFFSLIGLTPR